MSQNAPSAQPDSYENSLSTHQRHFVRLAQFNSWFNGQLFEHASQLDDAERKRDRRAFFGSIHATLEHILLCDRSWLSRVERSDLPFPSLSGANLVPVLESLDQGISSDWDELCRERRETDAVMEAFVRELTPELLDTTLDYQNSSGTPFSNPLWHVVAHIFNHGTHHRGQATTLLMQAGIDPGITDFLIAAMMPFPE